VLLLGVLTLSRTLSDNSLVRFELPATKPSQYA
jgi:hypothetical protein